MESIRRRNPQADLISLEVAEASARGGFACVFSNSQEYESALIDQRRAQGRYGQPLSPWPLIMFLGSVFMVAGIVLLMN
ncbi:MAG TPA: hypothetical protein VNX23_15245 [Bradyrhizobium sp.]|jgi:hypothetical protein|uniref:hypothetical protein n=1 Tax=Bradyrhizobium sp. TaxID=376 RepID=UPI002D0E614C|nr:hypothetical protein [Bradyrhizobium sp.]HXB78734.1 hypothetical protein [Bradyrhizobium sp.]